MAAEDTGRDVPRRTNHVDARAPAWLHGSGSTRKGCAQSVATIAEVASEARVGVATVSRVLNGSPAVRDETRRRVLDAIARLGYAPNATARALSSGCTRCPAVGSTAC